MQELHENTLDLLAEKATVGLDSAEETRLQEILADHPDWDDPALELAAAMVELTRLESVEPLPEGLRSRLELQAPMISRMGGQSSTQQEAPVSILADHRRSTEVPPNAPSAGVGQPQQGFDFWRWSGWVAAAACFLMAVLAWPPGDENSAGAEQAATFTPGDPPPMVPPLTEVETKAALLSPDEADVRWAWQATEDETAQGASGEVLWNSQRQVGYMKIAGLAVNDPAVYQYQLWIFDADRDERHPVDGGVFNIESTGEVLIPISAKLKVYEPTLFAVTVETPGGVVVSKRERIPLLAKAA